MAIELIQTSSTFKPDMIGDLVEITIYDQSDGSLTTTAGVVDAYTNYPDSTAIVIQGTTRALEVPTKGYTISIRHYEYVIETEDAE